MRVVLVAALPGSEALCAFMEEAPGCIVMDPSAAIEAEPASDASERPDAVIATDATSIEAAEILRQRHGLKPCWHGPSEAIYDRRAQRERLADLALQGLIYERVFPEADNHFEVRPARLSAPHGTYLHERFAEGQRYRMDTVSLDGAHVVTMAYEAISNVRKGRRLTRSLLALPNNALADALGELVRGGLTRLGITDGAASTEIVVSEQGPRIQEIIAAPTLEPPADACFAAFGFTHPHISTEAVLRPVEFGRRRDHPPRRTRSVFGFAPLHSAASGAVQNFDGLRMVRRLAGFHSITGISLAAPGAAGLSQAPVLAAFVHPDRASVSNSLMLLREMDASGSIFVSDLPLIDYAARPRA